MTNKETLLSKVEEKINHLFKIEVDFKKIFEDLFKQGFPSFWDKKGNFILQSKYQNKLMEMPQYHSNF